jgi:hypothetical protein
MMNNFIPINLITRWNGSLFKKSNLELRINGNNIRRYNKWKSLYSMSVFKFYLQSNFPYKEKLKLRYFHRLILSNIEILG